MSENEGRYLRLISNQVRFGCGYLDDAGERKYFAFHGYPNRNEDYFTTAEISQEEYERIGKDYPERIDSNSETAELFRSRYIEGHPTILEGWNLLP